MLVEKAARRKAMAAAGLDRRRPLTDDRCRATAIGRNAK
jgi:hypothetical protein